MLKTIREKVKLEYVAQTKVEGTIDENRYVEKKGWQTFQHEVRSPVEMQVSLELTRKASLDTERTGSCREWYAVSLEYYDHLDSQGKRPLIPGRLKQPFPEEKEKELTQRIQRQFPAYNVGVHIAVHTGALLTDDEYEALRGQLQELGLPVDGGFGKPMAITDGMGYNEISRLYGTKTDERAYTEVRNLPVDKLHQFRNGNELERICGPTVDKVVNACIADARAKLKGYGKR